MSRVRGHQSVTDQNTISLDRLEEYTTPNDVNLRNEIVVSFKTNRAGIFQIKFTEHGGIEQLSSEPPLYMFTDKERKYIEYVLVAIFTFLYPTTKIDRSMLYHINP